MGRKAGGKNTFHKPPTTVIRIPEMEKWAFEKMRETLKEDRRDSIDETIYPDLSAALKKAKEYSQNSRRIIYVYNREFYYWISLIGPGDIDSYSARQNEPEKGVVYMIKKGELMSAP